MDTLKLGFTLDESLEGTRRIKLMYPFAQANGKALFPHHQIDIGPLVDSVAICGEHFIVNCTCGELGCGGIRSGIQVAHEGGLTRWTVKEPAPAECYTFDREEYQRAVFRLIDDLAAIAEEPDGYNEYGYYGLDHRKFMEILERRRQIGQQWRPR